MLKRIPQTVGHGVIATTSHAPNALGCSAIKTLPVRNALRASLAHCGNERPCRQGFILYLAQATGLEGQMMMDTMAMTNVAPFPISNPLHRSMRVMISYTQTRWRISHALGQRQGELFHKHPIATTDGKPLRCCPLAQKRREVGGRECGSIRDALIGLGVGFCVPRGVGEAVSERVARS